MQRKVLLFSNQKVLHMEMIIVNVHCVVRNSRIKKLII